MEYNRNKSAVELISIQIYLTVFVLQTIKVNFILVELMEKFSFGLAEISMVILKLIMDSFQLFAGLMAFYTLEV
jgi:hypothetical protein